MKTIHSSAGEGMYIVEAVAVRCGNDVSVTIAGGEAYHIGASALGIPRPSLTGEDKVSASASVICVTGHKEDLLARNAALQLSSKLNCHVNVTVGLHIDHATLNDIRKLEQHCSMVLADIERKLQEE